jgi:hypothetical protein
MALDPQETATPPKLSPAPPARRDTPRWGWGGLLLAATMAVFTWMLTASILPRAVPPADVKVTPAADVCADAVEQVRAYQAPGQQETLAAAIAASLQTEGLQRPVAVVGWEAPTIWRGDCEVGLQVSISNEPTTLRWVVHSDTGRVEARNDLARRMSGW